MNEDTVSHSVILCVGRHSQRSRLPKDKKYVLHNQTGKMRCWDPTEKTTVFTKPASPPTKSNTNVEIYSGCIIGMDRSTNARQQTSDTTHTGGIVAVDGKGQSFLRKDFKKDTRQGRTPIECSAHEQTILFSTGTELL